MLLKKELFLPQALERFQALSKGKDDTTYAFSIIEETSGAYGAARETLDCSLRSLSWKESINPCFLTIFYRLHAK